MRYYEIIFMVHPDYSDQVPGMIDRFQEIVTSKEGKVTRVEDWGKRQLAYPIEKLHKAHYVLMNVEASTEAMDELKDIFRFNDTIIRNLVMKTKTAVTGESAILQNKEEPKAVEPAAK